MALSRINTNQIVDGAVATADIADGLITTAKLADGAVTTAKVGADAVTSAKIADDAINSEHYTDGSVDTAHITDANITTAKLADNAVTTAKITDGNITTAKVADDAVTQAKIGADAVGTTELANDVAINTSGAISTTSTSGISASHGNNTSNVATFINTGDNANSNGVVHVKQSSATNQPTMVIEQTGEGGNTGDKQGLLIKGAGQNQGDGLMFGIEVTNSNLASGNSIRPFSVWNGGYVAVENKNNETSFQIDKEGLVQEVQIPVSQNSMNIGGINQTVSGNADYVVTGLTSAYYNSNSLNNSGYFDSSTSRFTVPSGALSCHYFCHFQTLLGITNPSSGTHYGYLAFRINGTGPSNKPVEAYREVNNSTGGGSIAWETMSISCVVRLDATDYIEPVFSGSNTSIRIHSGTYTSFSVVKIG